MQSDLERLVSEDETARAGVDAARVRARERIDTFRTTTARQRDDRLRELQQTLDRSVAQILAEGEREVERRRAQRDASSREHAERAAALVDRGADAWIHIVRYGPASRGSP